MKKFLFQKATRFAVLFAAAAGFSALFTFAALRKDPPAGTVAGVEVGGAFALVDHTGKPVTEQDYADFHKIVFFGFTHCPEICPTTLQNIAAALDQLSPPVRAQLKTLFFTVDPARDTPARMAEYVAQFHPDIIGLTGSAEQVAVAEKAYKVYAAKAEGATEGAYNMNHSSYIYILSPDGSLRDILRADATPDQIRAALSF